MGLNGTGDSKSEFTNKSIERMLDRLGVKVQGKDISSKSVAAVIVTANLPPFARSGNKLDVTVSTLGDASSLKGGHLCKLPKGRRPAGLRGRSRKSGCGIFWSGRARNGRSST